MDKWCEHICCASAVDKCCERRAVLRHWVAVNSAREGAWRVDGRFACRAVGRGHHEDWAVALAVALRRPTTLNATSGAQHGRSKPASPSDGCGAALNAVRSVRYCGSAYAAAGRAAVNLGEQLRGDPVHHPAGVRSPSAGLKRLADSILSARNDHICHEMMVT